MNKLMSIGYTVQNKHPNVAFNYDGDMLNLEIRNTNFEIVASFQVKDENGNLNLFENEKKLLTSNKERDVSNYLLDVINKNYA